jgi:DNA-binding beta-propeller fold protein YncE
MSVSPRISASTLALLALLVTVHGAAVASPDVGGWGAAGEGAGELRSPVAIAVAGDRVYVADFDNDRIGVFTRSGRPLQEWGATGAEPGRFRGPAGVAIGPDGSVFVTDLHNHRVQRFSSEGSYLDGWPAGGEDAAPFGIAVDRAGRVFVTDLEAARVGVWDSDGSSPVIWGTRGGGDGELDEPWGIAVDGQGDVLVADHGNDRIQRFSADGTWLGAWGDAGADDARLTGPMGLAIGRDGSVYVTDLAAGRVRRFTRGGELLASWGEKTGSAGTTAVGIALDAGGDVFTVDPLRQRITRIPGASIMSPTAIPVAFAMLPIAQPLGRGPVTLEFAIPEPGTVGAEFYSLDGRKVRSVPGSHADAGTYRITWDTTTDDGRRAPVGVYFVRSHFELGGQRITRTGRVVVLH